MRMLDEYGTELIELKPSSVLYAAENDLRARQRNIERQKQLNRAELPHSPIERYAFVSDHVRKAKTGRELLQLALEQLGIAATSTKRMTRYLYQRPELLAAALELAPEVSTPTAGGD